MANQKKRVFARIMAKELTFVDLSQVVAGGGAVTMRTSGFTISGNPRCVDDEKVDQGEEVGA